MSLTGHIFRKDVRHLLPEICLNVALLVAFGWSAPKQWGGIYSGDQGQTVAILLRLLIPIAWLLTLSRLVHEESLVGDRQFWVTRPYRWGELLGAKLLFVICFLFVPLLLVRLYLLQHARLSVAGAFGDLLWTTVALLLVLVLPMAALATVTASFGKHVLVTLAAILYGVAVMAAGSALLRGRSFPPYLEGFLAAVAGLVLLGAIGLQYARRRTWVSRWVLAGLPLVMMVFALAAPAKRLFRARYAATNDALGREIRFTPNSVPAQSSGEVAQVFEDGNVLLELPVYAPRLPEGARTNGLVTAFTVSDGRGFRWEAPFAGSDFALGDKREETFLNLRMPAKVFAKVRQTPVRLEVEIATLQLEADAKETERLGEEESFRAPGGGVCSILYGISGVCLYGERKPVTVDMETIVQSKPCGRSGDDVTQAPFLRRLGEDESRATWDIDPVETDRFSVGVKESSGRDVPAYACSGSAIELTPHHVTGRERLLSTLENVVLGQHAWTKTGAPHPDGPAAR